MFRRACILLPLICLVVCATWAADDPSRDPMMGTWKLDSQKSRIFDEMKVTSLGGNRYSFNFGGPQPETIVVDGTDQQGNFGTTLAVAAMNPNEWTVIRKKDGRILLKGVWTLSKDTKTLRDDYSEMDHDGKVTSHVIFRYERRQGGHGFAGDWVSTSQQMDKVYVLQVRPYEGDGLSSTSSLNGVTKNVKFDGKDYPYTRPGLNAAASAQRLNEKTVELTDKLDGKAVITEDLRVSEDGKTLTMTIRHIGRSEKE